MGAKRRGSLYWYDFDSNGCIRPERVPTGSPMIVWANGIPHCPVYDQYYIFAGAIGAATT